MPERPDWKGVKAYILDWLASELPGNLIYHSIRHTRDDVLPAAERLAELSGLGREKSLLLRTAALYHDTGYVEQYERNEHIGIRFLHADFGDREFAFREAQDSLVECKAAPAAEPRTLVGLGDQEVRNGDVGGDTKSIFGIAGYRRVECETAGVEIAVGQRLYVGM